MSLLQWWTVSLLQWHSQYWPLQWVSLILSEFASTIFNSQHHFFLFFYTHLSTMHLYYWKHELWLKSVISHQHWGMTCKTWLKTHCEHWGMRQLHETEVKYKVLRWMMKSRWILHAYIDFYSILNLLLCLCYVSWLCLSCLHLRIVTWG